MGINIKKAIDFLNLNGWDIMEYEGKYYTGDTPDTEISCRKIEQIYNSYKEDKPKFKEKSKPRDRKLNRSQFRSLKYELDDGDED
jgi:hypothetical protein